MKVKNENEVAQSCPTLSDPMDCNPPVHGIFQARVLGWVAIAFYPTTIQEEHSTTREEDPYHTQLKRSPPPTTTREESAIQNYRGAETDTSIDPTATRVESQAITIQ